MDYRYFGIVTFACVTLTLITSAPLADNIKKDGATRLQMAPLDTSIKKNKILLTSDYVPYKDYPDSHFEEGECIIIKKTGSSPDKYKILVVQKNSDLDCIQPVWQEKGKDNNGKQIPYVANRKFPGSSSYKIYDAKFKLSGVHESETDHVLTMVVVGWVNDDDNGLPNEVEISIDEEHHAEEVGGESHPGHGRYR